MNKSITLRKAQNKNAHNPLLRITEAQTDSAQQSLYIFKHTEQRQITVPVYINQWRVQTIGIQILTAKPHLVW